MGAKRGKSSQVRCFMAIKPAEIVLEGLVIAVAWGPSGEVTDVGLATFDETEYRVDSATAGEHLLRDYLRKRVRLSAVLKDGRVFRVTRVELVALTDSGP